MQFLRRFMPQSVVGQVTGLVAAATLLGVTLPTIAFAVYLESESRANPELIAATQAARIATIVKQLESAPAPTVAELINEQRRHGVHVENIQMSQLAPAPKDAPAPSPFLQSVSTILKDTWGITTLTDVVYPPAQDALILKASNDGALVLRNVSAKMMMELVFAPSLYVVVSIALFLLLFSLFGVHWITSPLASVARVARSFPRENGEVEMVSEEGPREIVEFVKALNDAARRVRSLLDERTRLLVAISHDMRTPLTRLRLRAERIEDVNLHNGLVADIAAISDMLNATLMYLRDGGRREPVLPVDLSSLLQTIRDQFSDVGHSVSYQGPRRFPFACRAHALNRAVTNIVENGVKNGTVVTVTLKRLDANAAQIEISDDGPGIPIALHEKVFDPFFKGDGAQSSSKTAGFGLGLSIARDVVRGHGGDIALFNRAPHGLTVLIHLKSGHAERPLESDYVGAHEATADGLAF